MSEPVQATSSLEETLVSRYGAAESMDATFRRSLQARTLCRVAAHAGAGRRRAWRTVSAVAALAATVGLAGRLRLPTTPIPAPQPSEIAAVLATRPPAYLGTQALRPGLRITPASELHTGPGGLLSLVGAMGSELTLGPNTRLLPAVPGTIRLAAGSLHLRNRQHEFNAVETPAGRVALLGTEVQIDTGADGQVTVSVIQGKVDIADRYGHGMVAAGSAVLLPRSGASSPWTAARPPRPSPSASAADLLLYSVQRGDGPASEVWSANLATGERRLLRIYAGWVMPPAAFTAEQGEARLTVRSALWTTPDERTGIADGGSGHPIVQDVEYALDPVIGFERVIAPIEGFRPLYPTPSPDGRWLAFTGYRSRAPGDRRPPEGGVWLVDAVSGGLRRLLVGAIMTPVAWSPDSRRLVLSRGQSYTNDHDLVLVDIATGGVVDLGINGAGALFSPDGSRIAYCGEFRTNGSWYRGVPMSGSLFVLDLRSGSSPVQVSGPTEGVIEPRWSPDGARLLYSTRTPPGWSLPGWVPTWLSERLGIQPKDQWSIYVARADGSGSRRLFDGEGYLAVTRWRPDGRAVVAADEGQAVVVNADTGGLLRTIRLDGSGGPRTAGGRAQSEAAVAALRRAIYRFAVASGLEQQGDAAGARSEFRAAATMMGGIPFRYPLAGISAHNMGQYADEAARKAGL